ncbi:hypothetical protein A9Q99_05300 [Gammaproteobacteria bacterium 45_16_T64]|nr:hypothetical protein A9Q99_05300 [Gammaproteobacteria bacterium 45_16_T64]
MTLYSYTALQDRKKEIKGEIDATTEREAVQNLRGQGLFVTNIRTGSQPTDLDIREQIKLVLPANWLPPKKVHYIQMYRQLSLMLMSGHTLLESLELCGTLAPRRRMMIILQEIRSDIQRGLSFAQAMEKFPKAFEPQVFELVRSAEASGELDSVLSRLANDLERMADMKKKLTTAMIYPVFVLSGTVALLILMAVWVLPKMSVFIDNLGSDIPASTANMMAVSAFIVDYGTELAAGSAITIFLLLASYTTLPGKRFFDRIFLSLPMAKSAITTSTMAQTGWTLSMLTASGVTIIDAMKICERITSNETLKNSFDRSASSILEGSSLSAALEQPFFPELFYKMAAVGEQSGELDRVMNEIGTYYNGELEANLQRMLAFITPLLTLLMGGPVAFVYLSIFQLIFAAATGGR